MDLLQDEDVQWRVINSHFETYGHAHHQIEGMEHFMKALLPHIVKEQETISLEVGRQKHLIHIKNVTIVPPNFKEVKEGMVHAMTSHEARKRGLDLTTPVLMTLEHEIQSFNEEEELMSHTITPYVDVPLCRIPAMVGMRYAGYEDRSVSPYDEGGYFVINGIEKVLIPQLKLRINIPFVWNGRSPGKYLWMGEVRSCHPTKYRSTSTLKVCLAQPKKGKKIPTLVSLVPFVSKGSTPLEIPLRYMFRILLVDDVDAIVALVDDADTNEILRHSLEADDKTKEDILDWVGVNGTKEKTKEKQRKYVMHIFVNEYFPHLGMNENPDTLQRKAWFLAYMCRRVIRVHLGKEKVDDRDSYKIKRLDGPGPLLAVLFRQHYRNFIKQFKMSVTRDIESGKTYVSILDHINSSRITAALLYHFKTGNWSLVSKTKYTGVVQQLSRITRAATNSHLRRLGTPMVNKDGKSTIPRMIHADDFGINCIVETPEGAPVGLVKNLALVTYLAIGSSAELLERHIKEVFTIEPMGAADIPTMVFVNGYMIGKTKDPDTLVEQLIELRRCEDIPFDTTVLQNPVDGHVLVYSDCGRCIRPVYVLKNLYKFSSLYARCSSHELWLQLRVHGVIEYLDKMEENARCLVAMRPEEVEPYHTHLELHPSVMFGLTGCEEVFPERNQAPRNMYQASMGKQAIGVSTLNYQDRFDMHQLVLDYPQRPLVTTRIQGIRKQGALPSAQEVVVAIMCYGGFNQEDAVLINQSALDRGLFSTTKYVVYTDDLGDRGTEDETFCNPSDIPQLKNKNGAANYSKLEEDGFVAVGVKVEPNDVIIGKVMTSVEVDEFGNQVEVKRCKSTVVKKGDGGYIEKVMLTSNRDGNPMVRVKIRSRKVPIIGDKLCVPTSHYVLTDRGWVQMKDITLRHKVATLRNGNVLDYVCPTAKYEYQCMEEELYHLDCQQIKITCTKQHMLYVQKRGKRIFDFVRAEEAFGKRVRHKKDARNDKADQPMVHLRGFTSGNICSYPMDGFLQLLGAFVSDGYVDVGKKHRRIAVCMVKQRKKMFLCKALDTMGIHYNIRPDRVLIGNRYSEVIDFFEVLYTTGAANKYLPSLVWTLSQRQSIVLMNALLQGAAYFTSSKELAEDVQRLALHCGWSGNITLCKKQGHVSYLKGRKITSNFDGLRVGIVKKKNHPQVNHGHVHRQTEEYIRFSGAVGCIEVPGTNLFFYKASTYSPPCWTGNSSRHGQKGTIGMTYRQEDMPFGLDVMTPDIIVNPNALPSRMTIGQLMECLLSKTCAISGAYGDGTAFRRVSAEDIADELQSHGFHRYGNQVMHNGFTGEMIETDIFIGTTCYQRLKHRVEDKVHARAKGRTTLLTRQPSEGRSNEGGLRFGEMERDALLSHGSTQFILDRLFHCSDPYSIPVCDRCGLIGVPASNKQFGATIHTKARCCNRSCHGTCWTINIPYSMKLLLQEIQAMGVVMRLRLKKTDDFTLKCVGVG
jgi:DNA-directed RNA polymerase II subunit RPB2